LWNDSHNADTFAWLVTGLLQSQKSTLPDWISGRLSKAEFAQSRERQARRWLGNAKIDPVNIRPPAKVPSYAAEISQERLERMLKMNRTRFKRRTGIYPETFSIMENDLIEREGAKKKSGRPAALSSAEQLLLALEFWREYRTFAHLGDD